ncbi:MAG: recombinase RecT [Myxococcales bacterium]|nr:recombinase RecT [Myxococcales bacterium]
MSIQTAIATMDAKQQAILAVIPASMRAEMDYQGIRQSVAAAIRGNPRLGECSPESIYTSAMYISRLGLDIGGHEGQAFLVPFAGQCTPMIGVRGKEVLAYRSGAVDRIMSGVIRENDIFDHNLADGSLSHKLDLRNADRGKALGSWARVWMKGSPHPYLEIMTESDFEFIVEGIRAKNRGNLSGAYTNFPDEMRRNRVLSRCLKRIPKSKDKELSRVLYESHALEVGEAKPNAEGRADVIEAEIVPEVRLSYDDDEKTPGFAEAQVKAAAARQTSTEGSEHGPPTPPPSDDSGMP